MKKFLKKLLFLFIFILPFFAWADDKSEDLNVPKDSLRYISADTAGLKEKASVRAKDFYELVYADVVVLEEEKGNWSYIYVLENPAVKGWINSGFLSKRKIVANGRKRFVEADEIALAGKGLDKSLSDIKNNNDDFEIDPKNPIASIFNHYFGTEDKICYFEYLARVDESSVDNQELFEFIEDGKLKLQEEE